MMSQRALGSQKRTSSPSQLAMTIVRRGFHPFRRSAPSPRTTSCNDAVPEVGSAAPITHAVEEGLINR